MKKQVFYQYLGTNGTITSPVHLEGVYYVRKFMISADEGKKLTKDNKTFTSSTMIPEEELEDWKEV